MCDPRAAQWAKKMRPTLETPESKRGSPGLNEEGKVGVFHVAQRTKSGPAGEMVRSWPEHLFFLSFFQIFIYLF